jgi:cytidylate kinase
MASENARVNSDKANRIKNNLNGQLRELQSLQAEIKRRDAKDLDELRRAEHIAKAAAQLRTAISALTPATQGPAGRGFFS